ncbi:MAG: 2-hydroxyacyl-CoA dehydratase family protein [Candidatus Abyssubacteria bacterium]
MEQLEYFAEIASELNNREIRAWKDAGGRVVGTVCSNIPEEILHAAGLASVRLRAPGLQDTSSADSQLHRINCSYTRAVLEMLMRGELRFLDGLVTTNTCDHMLRLAGEMQAKAGMPFAHYFSMYHTLGQFSEEWFIMEMEKLMRAIEAAFGVTITEQALLDSVALSNRTRRLMARLNELRKSDPPRLSGAEYLQISLAGMSMPREWFNERLEALLPALEGRPLDEDRLPRLMLIGGGCDSPDFVGFIESKGARFVADALCFGSRHYQGLVDEDGSHPLRAIAARYTGRVACPSIIDGFDHSYTYLTQLIRDWNVQGVICARLKFCDHWAGFRKMMAEELRGDGVPTLDLEREYATTSSGQISTRVQAFLEMMK